MKKVKSLLNKMSSPMRPPAGLGDLRLTKSFVSKVFSLFITTQSAEDSRQRRSGMTALLDVKAFTLVELLVVVLIIGILSAIAIPMYQGAVDKSHWSTMLPASKAIKDAEEAFKMTNGEYSDTMEHLDVQISNDDLTFTLNTPNNLSQPNVIRVTNSKLDNVRLASYLDDSPKFAGQLHCEAKNEGSTPNERGQRLCEKLLNGQYLKTTDDGYTRYLLDQSIDQSTCDNADLFWSKMKSSCYQTKEEHCVANGNTYTNGFCGCNLGGWGACSNIKIYEGGTCIAMANPNCQNVEFYGASCNGCNKAILYDGAECIGTQVDSAGNGNCHQPTINAGGTCRAESGQSCYQPTVNAGGVCIAEAGWHSCGGGGTINEGGKCIAKAPNTCTAAYNGGCCEDYGKGYCPKNAPKC